MKIFDIMRKAVIMSVSLNDKLVIGVSSRELFDLKEENVKNPSPEGPFAKLLKTIFSLTIRRFIWNRQVKSFLQLRHYINSKHIACQEFDRRYCLFIAP